MIVVHRQTELLQIVDALHPPSCFASRLDRGQEQRDEYRDDRDDDEHQSEESVE